MKVPYIRGLAALALSTSLTALSAPAFAQLDEIIVTATKTEQSLQDVSASIVAFDVEALEANRIEGLEDIAQFTPGLYSYPAAANSSGLRISLRGIGTFDPQLGVDSKVAIYTDGVYLGKVVGLAFDSPDLERVEVLKGPQGTLYGRNAVAGAINLISATPDPTRAFGNIEGEYGNYNAIGLKGFVNVPLGERAAIRVSANHDRRDGWVENLGPGNDYAGYDRYGVRGSLLLEASDDFDITLTGEYNKSTNEPYFYQAFDINTPTSLFANAIIGATDERIEEFTASSAVGDGFAENVGFSLTTNWDFAENHSMKTTLAWRGLDGERYVTLNPMANPAIIEAILNGDTDRNPMNGVQSINSFVAGIPDLLAITPGAQARADFANFIPRSPITGLFQSPAGTRSPAVDGHSQISFETTSTGTFNDGRIEYTAGVYYYNEKTDTGVSGFNGGDAQDYLDVLAPTFGLAAPGNGCRQLSGLTLPPQFYAGCNLGGTAATSAAQAGAFAGIYSNLLRDALTQVRFSTGNILQVDTEAYAAYGQMTFNVNDQLRLIGGLRYSDESKNGFQQNSVPFFRDFTDFLGNPILPQTERISFNSLDPQAIVEYDVNDDVMLYASYSQAFRSGGFNASASQLPAPGENVGPDFIFQPEEITSYEAGFKSEFGGRFRLNAAAFIYDLPNEQVTVSIDPLISTKRAIVNTQTDVWGIEADATAAITEEITLAGNVSYINGESDDIVSPNPAVGVVTRDQLQGTPKLSYSVSANYNGELENGMRLFGNVNFSHKDKAETTPFLFLTNQNLVSARIGFGKKLADGREVYLAFWGQNLTDDKYTVDTLPFETFAKQVHVFGTPRTYGATLGFDF